MEEDIESIKKHLIECQFDSFCKKIIRNEVIDIRRETGIKDKRIKVISVADIEEYTDSKEEDMIEQMVVESFLYHVLEYDISVGDESLAKALDTLKDPKLDIVLLYYFLKMKDEEIGEELNLARRTVNYHRLSALKHLKRVLEGDWDEY